VELDRPCGELVTRALDAGLLINVTAERVIRLLPPLIFTEQDAHALVQRLAPLVRKHLEQ
jgi:acetylornithine aminotransferase